MRRTTISASLIVPCVMAASIAVAQDDIEEALNPEEHIREKLGKNPSLKRKIELVSNYAALQHMIAPGRINRLKAEISASGDAAMPILIEMLESAEETTVAISLEMYK